VVTSYTGPQARFFVVFFREGADAVVSRN
jgi:hypothetical protein